MKATALPAAARASAEAERATVLRQANESAAQLEAEAQQVIARDRQSMREALEHEAADLAVTVAKRLLERIPVQALNRCVPGRAGGSARHASGARIAAERANRSAQRGPAGFERHRRIAAPC